MRRQKKFYAWGYADEDLSPDEIKPWEAEIAERYRLPGFDITPAPKPEEITLRKPRVEVPRKVVVTIVSPTSAGRVATACRL